MTTAERQRRHRAKVEITPEERYITSPSALLRTEGPIMPKSIYDMRDEILALNPSDRASLLTWIAQRETVAPYTPSRADGEVWAALVRLCPSGMKHRNLDEFLRDKRQGMSRNEWADAVQTIGEFCAQAKPVRRSDEDREALTDLVLECLAADLRVRNEALNPKSLLTALPRLATAVDQAYPGYLEAGLLHKLIRLAEPAAV